MRMILILPIASLLTIAAILKSYELVTNDVSYLGYWHLPKIISVGIITLEMALAGHLLVGSWPRLTYWLTLGLFSNFMLFSLLLVWLGATSCGCFGALSTPPWISAALDGLVISVLVWQRQRLTKTAEVPASTWRNRGGIVVVFMSIIIGIMIGILGQKTSVIMVESTGSHLLSNKIIVGQRISAASQKSLLDQGTWIVVFYRDTCSHCRAELCKWVAQAEKDKVRQWAFVNVGPEGQPKIIDACAPNQVTHWQQGYKFLTTPLSALVEAGVVQKLAETPNELLDQGLLTPP